MSALVSPAPSGLVENNAFYWLRREVGLDHPCLEGVSKLFVTAESCLLSIQFPTREESSWKRKVLGSQTFQRDIPRVHNSSLLLTIKLSFLCLCHHIMYLCYTDRYFETLQFTSTSSMFARLWICIFAEIWHLHFMNLFILLDLVALLLVLTRWAIWAHLLKLILTDNVPNFFPIRKKKKTTALQREDLSGFWFLVLTVASLSSANGGFAFSHESLSHYCSFKRHTCCSKLHVCVYIMFFLNPPH